MPRTERLDFRLTSSNRRLIERAARLVGQPLTAFAVQALVDQAEKIIAEDNQRRLSARDWKRFLAVLDDSSVSPALERAAARFRKRTGSAH